MSMLPSEDYLRDPTEMEKKLTSNILGPDVKLVLEYRSTRCGIESLGGRLMKGSSSVGTRGGGKRIHVILNDDLLRRGNLGHRVCTFLHELFHYKMMCWKYPVAWGLDGTHWEPLYEDFEELLCECYAIAKVRQNLERSPRGVFAAEFKIGLDSALLTAHNHYAPKVNDLIRRLGRDGDEPVVARIFKTMKANPENEAWPRMLGLVERAFNDALSRRICDGTSSSGTRDLYIRIGG